MNNGEVGLIPNLADLASWREIPWTAYDRDFSLGLIEQARGGSSEPWEHRRIAVLMLENQLLLLSPQDLKEHDLLLVRLGLKAEPGRECPLDSSLLQTGYTCTDLEGFIPQLRRRLNRFKHFHRRLNQSPPTAKAIDDFLHLAQHECHLTLARYLFTADEVADRIADRLRSSKGLPDLVEPDHPCFEPEAQHQMAKLPPFEARIMERLLQGSRIYWTSETVPCELNSLLEHPLGAVVLTLKPPGSHLELEIKRTGHRGDRPLSAAFERDGCQLAKAHRLDGGSFGHLLRFEAGASSLLSLIYRLTHGCEAPMGRPIALRSIQTIPSRLGDRYLAEYFTDQEVYGEGFGPMRQSLESGVQAFIREKGWDGPDLDSPMGRTAQFLSFTSPGQAILSGTSSFRLDRLAAYLGPGGPTVYFEEGLGIKPNQQQARRFAEEVLDEVLGGLTPPDARYQDHAQYVKAALQQPSNRERADRAYLAAFEEMARFWGTLLGVGAYSGGESFVARNVGLRSCWEEARWQVRILFMDHDNLNINGNLHPDFRPGKALQGMFLDWKAILGGCLQGGWLPEERPALQQLKGEAGYLAEIYRPSGAVKRRGLGIFDRTLENSFRKTRQGLKSSSEMARLFPDTFVRNLDDWDETAREFVENCSEQDPGSGNTPPALMEQWRQRTRERLAGKDYPEDLIQEYVSTASRHLPFLQRFSFLWEERPGFAPRRKGAKTRI